MEANRVPAEILDILDAKFYGKEVLALLVSLHKFGLTTIEELGAFVTKGATPTTYGYSYQQTGIRFVRSQNVLENRVDGECSKISEDCHKFLRRSAITRGNLLLSIVGASIGRAAVYCESEPANTNQAVAVIRLPDNVDAHWVSSWINSGAAQKLIACERSGLARDNFDLYQVRQLRVPKLGKPAQAYIGGKVRQAERLRERAETIERTARSEYDQHLRHMGLVEVPQSRCYRASLTERLDPAYYDPRWSSVLDSEWFRRASQPLEKFIREGTYGVLPDSATYGSGGKWLIRATDLDSCVSDPFAGVQVPESEVEDKARIRQHDLLLEVKGAIERCALASGPAVGKFVNGTVYRFAPKDIDVGYLAIHLTGRVKQMYCRRVAVNNIIQYLNLDCIRQLPVVRLGVEIEKELGSCFVTASRFQVVSDALVATAKALVEALIEGKVTEAGLKDAQESLQRGDTGPDREILDKLKVFSNLDDLYAALDESADASVTVETRG